MRIVFVSYNYSPDIYSPDEWIKRIKFYVGWLESLATEHDIIRVEQINYEGEFLHNGVKYCCVDAGKRKNSFPRKLNIFVKNLDPDLVFVSSFLFPLQLLQLRQCLGNKIKIIVQHHAEKPFAGIKKWLQYLASLKTDAGIFASKEIANDWVKKGNLSQHIKLFEIVGGTSVFFPMDRETARLKTGVIGSQVYLWVGRLNENKDPLTAVKAFLKFSSVTSGAKLYMIYQTDDLLQEIKSLIAQTEHSNSVILVGKIQHADLLYWFNSADFFLSASHYEGSGTALCEALSCGCIPIVTDIPSFRMISGNCGFLYTAGNESELLSALQQSVGLSSDEQRNKIRKYFKNKLSFQAIANQFKQVFASL